MREGTQDTAHLLLAAPAVLLLHISFEARTGCAVTKKNLHTSNERHTQGTASQAARRQ